jgi:hypothetical protein
MTSAVGSAFRAWAASPLSVLDAHSLGTIGARNLKGMGAVAAPVRLFARPLLSLGWTQGTSNICMVSDTATHHTACFSELSKVLCCYNMLSTLCRRLTVVHPSVTRRRCHNCCCSDYSNSSVGTYLTTLTLRYCANTVLTQRHSVIAALCYCTHTNQVGDPICGSIFARVLDPTCCLIEGSGHIFSKYMLSITAAAAATATATAAAASTGSVVVSSAWSVLPLL